MAAALVAALRARERQRGRTRAAADAPSPQQQVQRRCIARQRVGVHRAEKQRCLRAGVRTGAGANGGQLTATATDARGLPRTTPDTATSAPSTTSAA